MAVYFSDKLAPAYQATEKTDIKTLFVLQVRVELFIN